MPKADPSSQDSPPVDSIPPEFFEGLAWAIPTAFSGALSAFRFEQGDVLFRDPEAYEALEGGFPAGLRAVQVLAPKRSARVVPAEFEGDRRRSSWESEARIEILDLAKGTTESCTTSQGRLMMMLWHDDEGWLDPEREAPSLPRNARELAGRLEAAREAMAKAQKTRSGARFAYVVDLASDASRVKAETIEQALAGLGGTERIELPPERAGIEDAETYHPALVVRALCVRGAAVEAVEGALRGALYGGAHRAPEPDDEDPATDRFSVARHGLLDALPWKPPADPKK